MKERFEEKFEELVNTAKTGADALKQNVTLRKDIHDTEDAIAVSMYDLGCETFDSKTTGETDEEAIDMLVSEIKDLRRKLSSLRAELNALNGKVSCPSCGKVTSNDYDFCPFCGTKLFDVVLNEEDTDECGDDDEDCCCECCGETCEEDKCCEEEPCCDCCEEEKADTDEPECEVEVEITVNDEGVESEETSETAETSDAE